MKFISKFNHGFLNRGCWHCALLTTYKARDVQLFIQNEIYKDLRMFKYNMKFTRAAY